MRGHSSFILVLWGREGAFNCSVNSKCSMERKPEREMMPYPGSTRKDDRKMWLIWIQMDWLLEKLSPQKTTVFYSLSVPSSVFNVFGKMSGSQILDAIKV